MSDREPEEVKIDVLQERLAAKRTYDGLCREAVQVSERRTEVYEPFTFEKASGNYRMRMEMEVPSAEVVAAIDKEVELDFAEKWVGGSGIQIAAQKLAEFLQSARNKWQDRQGSYLEVASSKDGFTFSLVFMPATETDTPTDVALVVRTLRDGLAKGKASRRGTVTKPSRKRSSRKGK